MSCGVPVIASDVKGINNMLENGVTGILVPPKQPDQLSTAIKYLLENDDKRKFLSQNAREYAIKHFSNVEMFNQYLNHIK